MPRKRESAAAARHTTGEQLQSPETSDVYEHLLDADLMQFLTTWLQNHVAPLTAPPEPLPATINDFLQHASKSQQLVLLIKTLVALRDPKQGA